MHLICVVNRQALLTHRRSLRKQLLLALGFQGPVGLQGTAEVHHRIHAGHALGIGAHHPIGEAALLVLDLLGQIPHRRQLQRPPETARRLPLRGARPRWQQLPQTRHSSQQIGERNPTVDNLSHPAWQWEATSGIGAGPVFAVA